MNEKINLEQELTETFIAEMAGDKKEQIKKIVKTISEKIKDGKIYFIYRQDGKLWFVTSDFTSSKISVSKDSTKVDLTETEKMLLNIT
jgi:hypothetical protein